VVPNDSVSEADSLVIELAAGSGMPGVASRWYDIDPDCNSRGLPEVRVTLPPAHGHLETSPGTTSPRNLSSEVGRLCHIPSVADNEVSYRPDKGYQGDDVAVLEVRYADGRMRRVVQRFAVWPIPFKKLVSPEPEYPLNVRQAGIEGKVKAWLHVDSEGNVSSVDIKSSPSRALSRLVERACVQWKFEPPSHRHTTAHIIADQDFFFHMAP
jgi:TonB family protein